MTRSTTEQLNRAIHRIEAALTLRVWLQVFATLAFIGLAFCHYS